MVLVSLVIFLCITCDCLFWFIDLTFLTLVCRFQLKQEQENRRNATMMYNTTKDKLRRTEEQQQLEVQERQKVELTLRNLELEMRTLVNNMKQVHPLKLHYFISRCACPLVVWCTCDCYNSAFYVNRPAWRGPQWDPETAGSGAQRSDPAGESAQQPSP